MPATQAQRNWIKDVLGLSFPAVSAQAGSGRQRGNDAAPTPPQPFQIFVKGLDDVTLTITLPNGPQTTIGHLQGLIADRTGIAPGKQNLTSGTKPINSRHADLPVSEYGLQRNQTLSLQDRLKGGFGERAAIADVILQDLRRGNVLSDIKDSGGQTTAKVKFHRGLFGELPDVQVGQQRHPVEKYLEKLPAEGDQLLNQIADEAVKRMDHGQEGFDSKTAKQAWLRDNSDSIKSMVITGGKAANCADYAAVVYTNLLSKTTGQTVYQVAMQGDKYDHQFVVTSPTNHGNDISKLMSDADAMVADGWWESRICTFARFIEGEDNGDMLNPYGASLKPVDLKIMAFANATGRNLDDQVAAFAAGKISDLYKKYEKDMDQGAAEYDKFTTATQGVFGQPDDDWNPSKPVDTRTPDELKRALDVTYQKQGADRWAKELTTISVGELLDYLKYAAVAPTDKVRAIKQVYTNQSKMLELVWELAGQNTWLAEMRTLEPDELAAHLTRPRVTSAEQKLAAKDPTIRAKLTGVDDAIIEMILELT